ncbi:MAG: HK97 family phage prohead protease [Flavobacteriaceae bacterium]
MEIEKRSAEGQGFEVRMSDKDKREIEGYGIVFNKKYKIWGRTYEMIDPAAGYYFKNKNLDVLSCFNHDMSKVLGRTLSQTMRFEVDKKGVKYIVKVAETTYGDDLLKSVERGDIRGSSFMFRAKVTEWTDTEDEYLRTIKEFDTVREMGPVTDPAYTDTTVAKRSFDSYTNERDELQQERDEQKNKAVKARNKRASKLRSAQLYLNQL